MNETANEIWPGVFHYQAKQWRTNSILMIRDRETLVIDPAWSPEEIGRIHDHALGAGGPIHLMLTHADCDHTVGFGLFAEAEIILERASADLFDNGAAELQLRGALAEWNNQEAPVGLRWDKVFKAGDTVEVGPFRVETIQAYGHVPDGVVLVCPNEGLMAVGDYLCASFAPLVFGSVSGYRESTERMLQAMDQHNLRWVVPGHGPLLNPTDAAEMARTDLRYLENIEELAAAAHDGQWSYGKSMATLMEVDPPRGSEGDIAYYAPQTMIAKTALREVGITRPEEAVTVWGP